jgi:hypothetical protein
MYMENHLQENEKMKTKFTIMIGLCTAIFCPVSSVQAQIVHIINGCPSDRGIPVARYNNLTATLYAVIIQQPVPYGEEQFLQAPEYNWTSSDSSVTFPSGTDQSSVNVQIAAPSSGWSAGQANASATISVDVVWRSDLGNLYHGNESFSAIRAFGLRAYNVVQGGLKLSTVGWIDTSKTTTSDYVYGHVDTYPLIMMDNEELNSPGYDTGYGYGLPHEALSADINHGGGGTWGLDYVAGTGGPTSSFNDLNGVWDAFAGPTDHMYSASKNSATQTFYCMELDPTYTGSGANLYVPANTFSDDQKPQVGDFNSNVNDTTLAGPSAVHSLVNTWGDTQRTYTGHSAY